MNKVPDYEEFAALVGRVSALEEENCFLRSLLLGKRWLSKLETMSVLEISDTTLWRLTKNDLLLSTSVGSKTMYDIQSVRQYLTNKKFTKKAVEDRIIHALHTPITKKPGQTSRLSGT